MVLLPLMLYITTEVTRRSRAAFRTVQRNLGALNAVMEENITGARVVQAFAREKEVYADFHEVNSTYRKAGMTADIITAALGPMFTTMMTITIAAAALLGGWLAIEGILEVGVLATLHHLYNELLQANARYCHALQPAAIGPGLAPSAFFRRLTYSPPSPTARMRAALEKIEGDVQFDNVSFSYEDEPQAAQERSPMARGNGQGSPSLNELDNRPH